MSLIHRVGFRCALAWSRIADIPNFPGRWGKALSSIAALGWAVTLLTASPNIWISASTAELLLAVGPVVAGLWMLAVAIVPIAGIALNLVPVRMLGASMGVVTWTFLLTQNIQMLGPVNQSVGTYAALALACMWADYRLARSLRRGEPA